MKIKFGIFELFINAKTINFWLNTQGVKMYIDGVLVEKQFTMFTFCFR